MQISRPAAHILVDRGERAVRVTLNRPEKRNALSAAMRDELAAALNALAADDGVSVVVITAEGPVYSAGFDTAEFYNRQPEHVKWMRESSERHHRALAEFPKPLIAAVQGPAVGGGFDVAVLCDVRLASPRAEFSQPQIRFGAPSLFAPLREIVGGGLARELCLTGRKLGAEEALRAGLISEIVAEESLAPRAMALAEEMAKAPLATLVAIKRQIIATHGGWDKLRGGEGLGGPFDFFA